MALLNDYNDMSTVIPASVYRLEDRIGRFEVSYRYIKQYPEEALMIMRHFVIFDVGQKDIRRQKMIVTAISPLFDVVDKGEYVPLYRIEVDRDLTPTAVHEEDDPTEIPRRIIRLENNEDVV